MDPHAHADFPDLSEDNRRRWDANARWWDDRIGDGNDFQTLLIEPATERLLEIHEGDVILDAACGAGAFSGSTGPAKSGGKPSLNGQGAASGRSAAWPLPHALLQRAGSEPLKRVPTPLPLRLRMILRAGFGEGDKFVDRREHPVKN